MTEWVSLPRPVSESTSITSTSRQRAPLRRYSPSPERSRRRRIEISLTGSATVPSELSSTISTSAELRACTPRPPPKITSCIDCPRTASGDCSPIAHSTASVTLDLPEPLGPTTTLTPGPEVQARAVREGLEALQRERLQMHGELLTTPGASRRPLRAASCSACFLLRPAPLPSGRPSTIALDLEGALVRRPVLGGDLVDDGLAALREELLQRRLEVDGMLERLLDLGFEGLDDRLRRALVAGVQVAGADHRLDHRGQHALGLAERDRALAHVLAARPRAAARAPRAVRRPRGRRAPRPPARGSSSAARRRSARPPGADRGAS